MKPEISNQKAYMSDSRIKVSIPYENMADCLSMLDTWQKNHKSKIGPILWALHLDSWLNCRNIKSEVEPAWNGFLGIFSYLNIKFTIWMYKILKNAGREHTIWEDD